MADTQKITAVLTPEGVTSESADGKTMSSADGPKPTDLLLMAVVECSGLTLGAVLNRDGVEPDKIAINLEGIRNKVSPREFTDINMHYDVHCPGLDAKKLERYLKIAERSCPVVQSLKAKVHVTYNLQE